MRCKHPHCPARKTVRVFVPEFEHEVVALQAHTHSVGEDPPRLPPGVTLPGWRRPKSNNMVHKKRNARAAFDEACKENAMQSAKAKPQVPPADVLCQVLTAQLTGLHNQPGQSTQSVATNGQTDRLSLDLLAVRCHYICTQS